MTDTDPEEQAKQKLREEFKKYVSDEEVNSLLDEQVSYIKSDFKNNKKKGQTPEMFVMAGFKKEGRRETAIVAMLVNDFNENRYKYMFGLGCKFAEQHFEKNKLFIPGIAFLVSEAWVRRFDKGEKMEKKTLADYDDKTEAVICTGMTIDGRCCLASLPVTRDADKIVSLGEPMMMYYSPDPKQSMESDLLKNFFAGYSRVFLDKFTKSNTK